MANDSIASIIEFLQEVSGSGNAGDHAEFLSNVRWHVTKLECAKLDLSENIGSMRGYVQNSHLLETS